MRPSRHRRSPLASFPHRSEAPALPCGPPSPSPSLPPAHVPSKVTRDHGPINVMCTGQVPHSISKTGHMSPKFLTSKGSIQAQCNVNAAGKDRLHEIMRNLACLDVTTIFQSPPTMFRKNGSQQCQVVLWQMFLLFFI